MAVIHSDSEKLKSDMFKFPFISRKIVYSPNCDAFLDGDNICKINKKQLFIEEDGEQMTYSHLAPFNCGESNCKAILTSMKAYEVHYACFHRYKCLQCKSVFPTQNFLDMHVQDFHNLSLGSNDSFSSAAYECPIGLCELKFDCIERRNEHLIKDHKYPPNFKFFKLRREIVNSASVMDTSETIAHSLKNQSNAVLGKYVPRVPQNICFGRGSLKAFNCRKFRQKTESGKQEPTVPNPQKRTGCEISMMELGEALN